MDYKLSDKTKEILEKKLGITIEDLNKMDLDEEIKFVEQKTGKKINWPENGKVEGLPICTMEDVDKEVLDLKTEKKKTFIERLKIKNSIKYTKKENNYTTTKQREDWENER